MVSRNWNIWRNIVFIVEIFFLLSESNANDEAPATSGKKKNAPVAEPEETKAAKGGRGKKNSKAKVEPTEAKPETEPMPEVEEKKPKRGGRKKDEAAKEIEPEAKPKETKAAKKTTKRKAANSEKEDEAPTENAGQEDGDDKAGKPEVKKPKKAKEPKAPAAVSSIKPITFSLFMESLTIFFIIYRKRRLLPNVVVRQLKTSEIFIPD